MFALLILLTGIGMTVYNQRSGVFNKSTVTITDTTSNKKTIPLFEVGYLLIDLDIFNGIVKRDRTGLSGDFMYPVLNTEITTRATTNIPRIEPNYSKIPYSEGLSTFIKLYKKQKTRLTQTWVACLLIKQKGLGKAINSILEYEKVNIDATEMYDGTDINHIVFKWIDSTHNEYTGFVKNFEPRQFVLDTMNMNSNVLVPICIMNYFTPTDPKKMAAEQNYEGWKQITNGIVLVPKRLKYGNLQGDTVHIDIEEFLERPILVSK